MAVPSPTRSDNRPGGKILLVHPVSALEVCIIITYCIRYAIYLYSLEFSLFTSQSLLTQFLGVVNNCVKLPFFKLSVWFLCPYCIQTMHHFWQKWCVFFSTLHLETRYPVPLLLVLVLITCLRWWTARFLHSKDIFSSFVINK